MAISPSLRILPCANRKLKGLIVLATTASGVDIALDLLRIWDNTLLSRTITGGIFGLSCGLFVASLLGISPRFRLSPNERIGK